MAHLDPAPHNEAAFQMAEAARYLRTQLKKGLDRRQDVLVLARRRLEASCFHKIEVPEFAERIVGQP